MSNFEIAKEFAQSLTGVEKIILFGSVARGEDRVDSDVDILIIAGDKQKTMDRVIGKATDILLDKGTFKRM